jgi:uncharacterized protein YndB with AHSA1/START domain
MMTTTHETEISADATIPAIRIVREFDAPAAKVFRAHTDPELLVRWLGPSKNDMTIDRFDCRTGGSYRYLQTSEGMEAAFHGSFHEVRPSSLIVQTFTWEGQPDGVALERVQFEDLPGGRSRLTSISLTDSFENRDAWMAGGMQEGVRESYSRLDEVLGD